MIEQQNKYEITRDGCVISYNTYHKSKYGKELKYTMRNGYLAVGLDKPYNVHRLVAETYISNPDNKPQVNHKNGNHNDNDPENCETLCTKHHRIISIANKHYKKKSTKVTA
jgi:hypothetical protein